MADMRILRKYSNSDGYYGRFTDTDSCFYFKPQFADLSESQFSFTMNIDEYLAMYHQDLQSRGHQATIKVEYDETQRQENPHFHKLRADMSHDLKSVATSNGHGEDFALFMDGRNYGWIEHAPSVSDSDYGKYRKVILGV